MITKINDYRKILENIEDINSDKALQISKYDADIKYYKTNLSKLDSITSLDPEKQEEEANKVINNNKYLGAYWKFVKSNKEAENMENKIRSSELTQEEKSNMEEELKRIKSETSDIERNIEISIKKDIDTIKKL